MVPVASVNNEDYEKAASYSYKLGEEYVRGYVDGLEAVKQAVFKILMTERYEYVIYSFNYGAELNRVMGRGKAEAKALLPGIIKDALLADSRIEDVGDFEFYDVDRNSLGVRFTIQTDYGEISTEVRVDV